MNRSAMKLWMNLQGGNAGVCRRLGKGWESAQLKWGASHYTLRPVERCPGCPHGGDLPYSSTRSRIVLLPNSPKMRHTGAPKSQEKKPQREAFCCRAACGQPAFPQEQQLISPGLLLFATMLGLHRPLNLPVVSRIGGCLLLLTLLLWPEVPKGGTRCAQVQGMSLPR